MAAAILADKRRTLLDAVALARRMGIKVDSPVSGPEYERVVLVLHRAGIGFNLSDEPYTKRIIAGRGDYTPNPRRRARVNTHIPGKAERTLARLVKRYGTANVIGEAHEIAGKRRRNPTRKRRGVVKRRRRNPTVGILAANPRGLRVARRISTRVEELRYQHSQDHKWYKHAFGPGVRLELLTDGSLRLCHPTQKLWERFA